MIDGFYSVAFKVPSGNAGGGVVVLLKGKIYGGDSSISYDGSYQMDGDNFTASVHASPFNNFLQSVFAGMDAGTDIELKGTFQASGFALTGKVYGMPETIAVTGKLISRIS